MTCGSTSMPYQTHVEYIYTVKSVSGQIGSRHCMDRDCVTGWGVSNIVTVLVITYAMFIVLTVILVMGMAVRVGSLGECVCVGAVGALRGAVGGAFSGDVTACKGRGCTGTSLGRKRKTCHRPNRTPAEAWLGKDRTRPSRARMTANLRHTLTGGN